ncbi:MAG: transglycosylase domain-containing protein, partial [Chloroflexales bacterium]|nr:transglycosylase domain-containing protein [Chloroflexales bacterium]
MLRRAALPSVARRLPFFGAQLLLALLAVLVAIVAATGTTAYNAYAATAASLTPRLDALTSHKAFQTSRIFDRNGTLLYEFFDAGKRTTIDLAGVSPLLISATVAIEDKTFYSNTGVDYDGIARTLLRSFSAGEETGGASTITQQLIKRLILTDDENRYENRYQRKLTEIILARELSTRFSKNDIMALYLNEIFYGNLAYGIQAASDSYFKTSARDLTLPQAALLAGLPQQPTEYDPINYLVRDAQGGFLPGVALNDGWWKNEYQLPDALPPPKVRQIAVLSQMVDEGSITPDAGRAAAAADLRFADQEVPLNAPHFVFYVRKLLEEKYGPQLVYGGGLQITTTLDLDMQRMVQGKAAEHIADLEQRNIHNAAVTVMQPNTGQILAMVGSIDFNRTLASTTPGQKENVLDGQVNMTIRERQPGSALKPFTYLAAMEKGMTPATVLWDVPTEFPLLGSQYYAPLNYNGRWNGPVRIRTALANSLNMPAVKALKFAGIPYTLGLLDRVGIKGSLRRGADFYGLSLTLGGGEVTPLELTTAYNTLASGGRYIPPAPILKIVDGDGNVLEEYAPGEGEQVVRPELVSIISDMMSDDAARKAIWGLDSKLKLTRPAAVKTGTSNDWRDAWTLGFTPYVTVGVWSGNNNNEPTEKVESLAGGGIIWHNIMEELFANPRYGALLAAPFPAQQLPLSFSIPTDSVLRQPICALPGSFGGYTSEIFSLAMLSASARATATALAPTTTAAPLDPFADTPTPAAASQVKLSCDAYQRISVVRVPPPPDALLAATQTLSDTAVFSREQFCLPVAGESYPPELLADIYIWNFPPPDPSEKVEYRWSWGGAGSAARVDNKLIVSLQRDSLLPCAATDFATPTPEPPTFGAVQIPDLRRFGENQAKDALVRLGIPSDRIVVDYQTRERVPDVFDQFAPYVVISTQPAPGDWYIPGTTIVLGIRAPDDYQPGPQP